VTKSNRRSRGGIRTTCAAAFDQLARGAHVARQSEFGLMTGISAAKPRFGRGLGNPIDGVAEVDEVIAAKA